MTNPKAVIFGCETTRLLPQEKDFFQRTNPLGFILFARNCETPEQVQQLVFDLRKTVDRDDAPVLIDQEGGRVARLKSPYWREAPPASIFGTFAEDNMEKASWCTRANSWLMGKELQSLNINVNCAPVVDVLHPTTHAVIGDRAFSDNTEIVTTLALQSIQGFLEAKVTPIIKHIPGHGKATVDSHEKLPVVTTSSEDLSLSDFEVFRQICQHLRKQEISIPWAMTAHIVYQAIDPHLPATQSSVLIERIIRNHIGFSGFLISDCLTMKALQGDLGTRAKKSLNAGCDAVLHCSGILEEMIHVAAQTLSLKEESMQRLQQSKPRFSSSSFSSEEETLMKLNQTLHSEGLFPLREM